MFSGMDEEREKMRSYEKSEGENQQYMKRLQESSVEYMKRENNRRERD